MIKCLRALSSPMAAEHGCFDDLFLAAPGELLSIPVHACREKHNPHCQCRRVFVGISTGNPATLAQVSLCSEEEITSECNSSPDIIRTYEEALTEDGILLHDPHGIAYAIRHFDVGSIIRVDRTEKGVLLRDTWHQARRADKESPVEL